MNQSSSVFEGEDAIRNFLHPKYIAPPPLVELPERLNPFRKDGVRIFAKLMGLLPLLNVKSIPAYNMLEEASKSGALLGKKGVVEYTSGNMALSLAVLAKHFGIHKMRAVVHGATPEAKLRMLQFFGVDIWRIEPSAYADAVEADPGIEAAKKMGAQDGWYNFNQFANSANPQAHEEWTAPQLWEQTGGSLTVLVAGLGTAGTLSGAGAFFKKQNAQVATVGVMPSAQEVVPGVRTKQWTEYTEFDWENAVDFMYEVSAKESFTQSVILCREGLMAGPSSGLAFEGLLQFFREKQEEGTLSKFRNSSNEVVAVFVCPDTPFPYIDEYFQHVDASYFQ